MDMCVSSFFASTTFLCTVANHTPSPEWVETEKKSFQEVKDKDGDGYLDHEELAAWIIPMETEYSVEEAKHLIEVREMRGF